MADSKVPLIAGMLIVLTLSGGAVYYLTNADQTYYCKDKELVTMCFKLSSGLGTRCYYDEKTPTKYVTCASGWKPVKDFPELNFTGKELNISSVTEYDKEVINNSGTYPTIRLINKTSSAVFAEYNLTYSTDKCISTCYMKGKAILYSSGVLFTDAEFLNLKTGKIQALGFNFYLRGADKNYQVEIDDYKTVCTPNVNGTDTCTDIKIGSHFENRTKEVWNVYSKEVLAPGSYEWKLEGNKKAFDNIDAIPFNQEKFSEWATWNSSFEVGLVGYYKLDETAGLIANNSMNAALYNGTFLSAFWTTVGIINGSYNWSSNENSVLNMSGSLQIAWQTNLSYSLWIRPNLTSCSNGYSTIITGGGTTDANALVVDFVGSTCQLRTFIGGSQSLSTGYANNNTWNYLVVTHTAGGQTNMYLNGTNILSVTGKSWTNSTEVRFGHSRAAEKYVGFIDEISIYNRTLSASEILDLYNNHTGLTWTPSGGDPPSNTCTYSSGNWNLACSDGCNMSSNSAITGNVTIYGSGYVNLSANWTMSTGGQYIFMNTSACELDIYPGSGINQ